MRDDDDGNRDQAPQAPQIPREVFLNDVLNALPPMTRLLFIGLLSLARDGGLVEDRPARIKAEILPYDNPIDVDDMLDHLVQVGLINRERDYTNPAERMTTYIGILRWEELWLMPEPAEADARVDGNDE